MFGRALYFHPENFVAVQVAQLLIEGIQTPFVATADPKPILCTIIWLELMQFSYPVIVIFPPSIIKVVA